MHVIQTYQSADGSEPYADWLARLADLQAKARVLVRVQRMAAGNFGDCKPPRRRRLGAADRLGTRLPRVLRAGWPPFFVLLLVGGDKRKQRADIAAALKYWQDWQRRNAP